MDLLKQVYQTLFGIYNNPSQHSQFKLNHAMYLIPYLKQNRHTESKNKTLNFYNQVSKQRLHKPNIYHLYMLILLFDIYFATEAFNCEIKKMS